MLAILEGQDAVALEITARERERARARGEAFDDLIDGKMSVFGLDEDVMFRYLEGDGWKWERWERLLLRETPD